MTVPSESLLSTDAAATARARLPRSLQLWLDAEQTRVTRDVDQRLVQRGDVSAIAEAYRPEARRVFVLATRWVAAESMRVTAARPIAPGLQRRFRSRGRWLFLAHPLAIEQPRRWFSRAPAGPLLYAAATSSTRSVLTWSPDPRWPPFFAKLSLPVEVGGVVRCVSETEAVTCVGLTQLLTPLTERGAGLHLLPEPLSMVPLQSATPGGYIVRSIPRSVLTGRTVLLPWFALTHPERGGGDGRLPALARRARTDLRSFALRKLLRPFLRAWLTSALEQGWCAEVHAQNLLVELDPRGRLTGRFFVRDLEGCYADLGFIERAHPRLAKAVRALPYVRNVADDYDQLEQAHGAALSLHTHFRSGPIWHLERACRRWARRGLIAEPRFQRAGWWRSFCTELATQIADPTDAPASAVVRSADRFAQWLLDQRQRRLPRPAIPAPLARWLEREQTANERARDPQLFAPISALPLPGRFDPAQRPIWPLEYLEIPIDDVAIAQHRPGAAVRRALFSDRRGHRCVRFFVHPWSREQYALDVARWGLQRGQFWATPTASIRSLAVWSKRDPRLCFGLKLSIDVEIQRIRRVVKTSKLARAIALTAVFDAMPRAQRRHHGVDVLREPLTLRLTGQEHGTIVRELAPDMQSLVPGFSLFAARPGNRPPLAIELAGRGVDAARLVDWLIESLWKPLVRVSSYLMFGQGLIGDLHQQNVLFECDRRGELTGRLVLRDLDSFKTDLELRRRRGRTVQPYLEAGAAGATSADLKLDDSTCWYDEAWSRELRAEWVYLATRLCHTWAARLGGAAAVRSALAGRRLWAAFDRLLLTAAAAYLGDDVVVAELIRLRRGRGRPAALPSAAQIRAQRRAGARAAAVLATIHDALLVDPRTPRLPLYSLNAMVHVWKRQKLADNPPDRLQLS